MEVTIKGVSYKIRYTLRALFIFEQITGKSFNVESSMEQFLFYYSILLANNPGTTLSFDDFIDACDDVEGSTEIIKAFTDLLTAQEHKMKMMSGGDEDTASGEKKS